MTTGDQASDQDRIIDLERIVAEQDHVIGELSGEVAEQWKVIEGLRKKLELLTDRFLVLEEQTAPDIPVTRPPHW